VISLARPSFFTQKRKLYLEFSSSEVSPQSGVLKFNPSHFERPDVAASCAGWVEDTEVDPYAGVEISGVHDAPPRLGRHGSRPPMESLLHETQSSGRWITGLSPNDLLTQVRCMDLVIVSSPAVVDDDTGTETDDIVARAGRPVLILPRKFAQRRLRERRIGHRIVIAWNASAESARAVHDAPPFLKCAEEVTLLFVYERHDHPGAQQLVSALAGHLQRHGVNARPEAIPVTDAWPARIILDRLNELDANLLVMGAFSRSSMREAWFGGVSADLLHAVTVPVLTSH
jgi:nucleotide-binding universal stress UspA family protein